MGSEADTWRVKNGATVAFGDYHFKICIHSCELKEQMWAHKHTYTPTLPSFSEKPMFISSSLFQTQETLIQPDDVMQTCLL